MIFNLFPYKYTPSTTPMASLNFTYGMVMSGKTAKFIKEIENEQHKNLLIMKPDIDYEFRKDKIKSRNGKEVIANVIISKEMDLCNDICYHNINKIYIDESQFLTPSQVDQLKELAILNNIDIHCFGIRTDFKSLLFDGAKRLFEVCDNIFEIESKCNWCSNKATHNIKIVDGMSLDEGETIQIVELGNEIYWPCCYNCYKKLLKSKRT